jgi:T4 superinfection immunity protein
MLLILLALYFLPTIVAGCRRHPNQAGIVILNLFLGWTFVGWVIALVWAVSALPQTNAQLIRR